MSDGWYFAQGGQRNGPMSDGDLRAAIAAGQVEPTALVWKEGMTDWMPIRSSVFGTLFPPIPGGSGSPIISGDTETYGAAPARTFTEAISTCFSKYVDFSGRASRSEYWYFALFTWLVGLAIAIVAGNPVEGSGNVGDMASGVWSLVTFLPGLAVGVRRLHDTDRSGWNLLWFLLPLIGLIILIVFFVQKPSPGRNRFNSQS